MPFTLLLGGARSGKSTLAVRLASAFEGPVVVVATAEPRDEEMAERIREHRAARPSGWRTIEAPLRLLQAVSRIDRATCVVLDCLTLWVSNALEAGSPERSITSEASSVAAGLADRPAPSVVVSNEVGLGIVPTSALARTYRDLLGRVNTTFAERAERSWFVVAGRGLPLEEVGSA